MFKKIIFISVLSCFSLAFLFLVLPAPAAQAQNIISDPSSGLEETRSQVEAFKDQKVEPTLSGFLATKAGQIISLVLSFVGVLFLILMIYAGITWMTAQGNEQQVAKSKTLMINAVIGIIIVFAAYALTSFIGQELLQ
ncbi:MAG: hypothetical protein WC545_01700 [Patescibacteria group bacterium]